jgi:hypothetical protein
LIQQIHYTPTTPKYNFPHPTTDTTLPQRFTELSLHSLRNLQAAPLQLNQHPFQQDNLDQTQIRLKPEPIILKPKHEECTVAAVDTSTIKIGETKTGILIAIRGTNVWTQTKTYKYTRLGPFIFHITEENKKQVYNALQATYFGTQHETNHTYMPNLQQMPMRIASLLERWIQATLSRAITNGLILFDGSLTAGTPDTPTQLMKEILNNTRKRNTTVLAFSKMTSLRINGHLLTDGLPEHKPPYLIETTGIKHKPPILLLGDVYVARLNKTTYAFRLDVDKEASTEKKIEATEKLLGNDLITQSYPETLRLAHILCTFTANEVIAMQHFATRKYGFEIIRRPDMHTLLFGPFGKGEGYQ